MIEGTGRRFGVACAAAASLGLIALGFASRPADGAFPGRNGRIVFATDRSGAELFTMKPNGRRQRQLTHIGIDGAYEPAYSPIGRQVAFTTNKEVYKIYTIRSNGTRQRPIPHHPPTAAEGLAAYSPNGKRIAFQSTRDGDGEIFTMGLDGTHVRQLTHNDSSDGNPDYSPNGNKVVFENFPGDDSEIWTMDADGSDQRQLTDNSAQDSQPAWGPRPRRHRR